MWFSLGKNQPYPHKIQKKIVGKGEPLIRYPLKGKLIEENLDSLDLDFNGENGLTHYYQ
jgi:hypothetical protein